MVLLLLEKRSRSDRYQPSSKQKYKSKQVDRHWYDDEEMDLLLKYYNEQSNELFTVLQAVMGTENVFVGNELDGLLGNYHEARRQGAVLYNNNVFVPVCLDGRHWVGLRLSYNAQRPADILRVDYFDPYGDDPDPEIIKSLVRIYGEDVQINVSDLPLQLDNFNCGPWVVQWLRALLQGRDVPDLQAAMDTIRSAHSQVPGMERVRFAQQARGRFTSGSQFSSSSSNIGNLNFGIRISQDQEALNPKGTNCDENKLYTIELFLIPFLVNHKDVKLNEGVLQNAVRVFRNINLGILYKHFCRHELAKWVAIDSIHDGLQDLKLQYKQVKAQLKSRLIGTKSPVFHFGLNKGWPEKVKKLQGKPQSNEQYRVEKDGLLAQSQSSLSLDMSKTSWFEAMVSLSIIRKALAQRNLDTQSPVQHVTVINFGSFQVYAVNHKSGPIGTTRMVWPIAEQDNAIRVVDLTYRQINSILQDILLPAFGNDHAKLARLMLGVLRGDKQALQQLAKLDSPLGWLKCSFLYGAAIQNGIPIMEKGAWVIKAAKSEKNLNKLNVRVTGLAAVCNILAILFLAEPRHALGMWRSTFIALELIATGYLTFNRLFSNLGGAIQYGRLLPGANFLSGALPDQKLKRLAMPLVDSVLKGDAEKAEYSFVAAVRGDGQSAIYQPLMKALFIEFVFLMVLNKDKKCSYHQRLQSAREFIRENSDQLQGPKPKLKFNGLPLRPALSGRNLWAPDGYVAWDVTADIHAFYRSISLGLCNNENQYGQYRMEIFEYRLGKSKKYSKLEQLMLYSTAAALRQGQAVDLSEYKNDPEAMELLRVVRPDAKVEISDIHALVDACNLYLCIWSQGAETLDFGDRRGTRIDLAVGSHFYLIRLFAQPLRQIDPTVFGGSSSQQSQNRKEKEEEQKWDEVESSEEEPEQDPDWLEEEENNEFHW